MSQHVIKVSKGQTITGAFYFENSKKNYDYYLFKEDGNVYILDKSRRKPKKAIPYLLACLEVQYCNDTKSLPYTFEKNIVEFSFTGANHLKVMEGQFAENGQKLIFKQSETGEILVVKEFIRIE
jgi:hypothetical protein